MTIDEFRERFGIDLNEQQEAATTSVSGQTLLLAVPGSGKTTTLIARVGYMIYLEGISPSNILVLTFTNAAADDMRKKFVKIFGPEYSSQLRFRTINSICNKLVMRYADIQGNARPEVLSDNYFVLHKLYREVYGSFPTESDIKNVQLEITRAKNLRLNAAEIGKEFIDDLPLKPLYDRYEAHLRRNNMVDFDDQLVFAYEILSSDSGALNAMQDQYKYLLVDEAQDTSKVQHDTINLLAGKYKNIFMVGDEDQSIYGFRAAYPEALLKFSKTFPDATVMKLERNYRSVTVIVDAANRFIVQNRDRYEKDMIADRTDPGELKIVGCKNREDQYIHIVEKILPALSGETAILYRNNDSAFPVAAELMARDIPFKCRGMEKTFVSSKPVQDVIRIMQSAFDPYNEELFMSTYSLFGARIRKEYAQDTVERCIPHLDSSLWETLHRMSVLDDDSAFKVKEIIKMLRSIRTRNNAHDAVCRIGRSTYKRATDDKVFILSALAGIDEPIDSFIERLGSFEQEIQVFNDKNASIVLSTIHGSKGLEYDNVILIDEILPVFPATTNDIEEERRLFYVGITRAKTRLYLMKYSSDYQPFIEFVEDPSLKKMSTLLFSSELGQFGKNETDIYRPKKKKASYDPSLADRCVVGAVVTHKTLGEGTITRVESGKMWVAFDMTGEEKVFNIVVALENYVFSF